MRLQISPDAEEEFRKIYHRFPEAITRKDTSVLESLLYHVAQQIDCRIGVSEGDLFIVTRGKK